LKTIHGSEVIALGNVWKNTKILLNWHSVFLRFNFSKRCTVLYFILCKTDSLEVFYKAAVVTSWPVEINFGWKKIDIPWVLVIRHTIDTYNIVRHTIWQSDEIQEHWFHT
jgi:hypothetical protein